MKENFRVRHPHPGKVSTVVCPRIGTLNPVAARQRLGLRQSSGALDCAATVPKAPEGWRSPKPCGASGGSWVDASRKDGNLVAEGVGFEPTVGLPQRLISSQVPLTTQPPFRSLDFVG